MARLPPILLLQLLPAVLQASIADLAVLVQVEQSAQLIQRCVDALGGRLDVLVRLAVCTDCLCIQLCLSRASAASSGIAQHGGQLQPGSSDSRLACILEPAQKLWVATVWNGCLPHVQVL